METAPGPDVLSLFWAPVCAVGSHGPGGPNAQLCVSVFGAGVVPDRPRLLVNLWKDNFTAELVVGSGTLAITVLADAQASLMDVLGLRSAHDRPKLAETTFELTSSGDPYFPEGFALLACEVIEAFDLGDAWAFLVAVSERRRLSAPAPMTRERMMALVGTEMRERWSAKIGGAIPAYRDAMHWIA